MPSRTDVLVITADDRFISSLLYAVDDRSWRLRWAKSIEWGAEMLARKSAPIVIFDCRTAVAEWESAVLTLALDRCRPAIIVAFPSLDEAMWQRALRHGAYDAVARGGDRSHLLATMRFALQRKEQMPPFAEAAPMALAHGTH